MWLISHHMDLWHPEQKQVRRALSRHGLDRLRKFCVFQMADMGGKGDGESPRERELTAFLELAEELNRNEGELTLKALAVKGGDLMAVGYPKSPELGKALNWLLELVIAGELPNEKKALLETAVKWLT